jgi:predicted secreted protein
MANTRFTGESIGLYVSIDSGSTWKLTVCNVDLEVEMNMKTIDATSKCDGNFGYTMAGQIDWSIKGSGLSSQEETVTSSESFLNLADKTLARTACYWKVADAATGATIRAFSGVGYITSLKETYPDKDVVKYDFTIAGAGTLTQGI